MSVHADALETLRTWAGSDARQEELRARYVAHLEAHPDGVERSCFPDHLTAGALVLDAGLDRVLLNLHRKARRWFAFGGHVEPADPTLAAAALREATEESGIDGLRLDPRPLHLDEHTVDFCDPRGTVRHLDVRFTALAPAGAAHATSEESLDVRWWPVDALPELEDEMHELIRRARERWSQSTSSPATSPGGRSSRAAADQPIR
ncbi:NUDIX domain-containing protein [Nocardioides sp. YIM 152315]|uniref:NUDIX hydrolase n=1 Tax=Nocardioides sp. YIM 152315 TaxID=3031760 RepID=UPI0023DBF7A9|nr:NUDIX domain-containing protein [Nocardioides sp. YIM 152315]MDF1602193.1 NUDIX domain-containing protein [Nocardioides sp. YIM 152315]